MVMMDMIAKVRWEVVVVVQKLASSSSFASKLLAQMNIEELIIDVAITLYKAQYTNARLETWWVAKFELREEIMQQNDLHLQEKTNFDVKLVVC